MSNLVFNTKLLDEIIDGVKSSKTKVVYAKRAEQIVYDLFKNDFEDLEFVNSKTDAMDIYSYRYKLRIEVKSKLNENKYFLERKFLDNIRTHSNDMSFVYINLSDIERSHTFTSKVYVINGYKLTYEIYNLLVDNIKRKIDNKNEYLDIFQATREYISVDEVYAKLDEVIKSKSVSEIKTDEKPLYEDCMIISENENSNELSEIEHNEAKTLISDVYGTTRNEIEKVLDDVFIIKYHELKNTYVINNEYKRMINDKLKEMKKPLIKMDAILEYLKPFKCFERRFSLNQSSSKTKVLSFKTETEYKNVPRNGATKFQNLEKEIVKINCDDVPIDDKYIFQISTNDNRNRGIEYIDKLNELISIHKTFFNKHKIIPSKNNRCIINDNEINLAEQLSYIRCKSNIMYKYIMNNVYGNYVVDSYEEEYKLFMNKLDFCVKNKKPFHDVEFNGYKTSNLNVYWTFYKLRYSSVKDKINTNLERLKKYEEHKNEINKFMKLNQETIEKFNLHAVLVNKSKIDGSNVLCYCYDFKYGI